MKKNFQYKIINSVKFLKKYELKYLILKAITNDLRFINMIRFFFFFFYFDSNKTKINLFCIKTKKIRGIVNFFNIFRMNFRENALFALYSGVKKKSW